MKHAADTLRVAAVVLAVASYPFLLVESLDHAAARTVGLAVLAVVVLAIALSQGSGSRLIPLLVRRFGLLVAVLAVAIAADEPVLLKALPSVTSLWLLALFGATLRRGPSMVEQFATSMHERFPDFLLPYCRRVTWVWCAFFFANAAAGIALALWAPSEVWAIYTGVVSYALMMLLATGEYVFHKTRFRFYEHGWSDRLWRRLCPPEATPLGRRTLEWQQSLADCRRDEPGPPGR
jgi:uncharacterized membrane protein